MTKLTIAMMKVMKITYSEFQILTSFAYANKDFKPKAKPDFE